MTLREAICRRYSLIWENALSELSPTDPEERIYGGLPRAWLALAAAAGCGDAFERAVFGLSSEQLQKSHGGVWNLPQYLSLAVQAVATHDPRPLADLALHWKRPADVTNEFSDIRWSETWSAALSYLKALGAINYEDVRHVKNQKLQRKVSLLWKDHVPGFFSWHDLVQKVKEGNLLLNLGQYDGDEMVERTLSASDLSELSDFPELLFVLLGRADRLDSTARAALFERLEEGINQNGEIEPVLLTLCEELSLDTQRARQAISRRLTRKVLHEKMPAAPALDPMYFYFLETGGRQDESA